MKYWQRIFLVLTMPMLGACTGHPAGVQAVGGFELDRYLGKWHEIARLDHRFERGLEQVTAQYSLREDGGVRVMNRGYSAETKTWEEAEGKAYFVNGPQEGYLKVSFFGPFYGAYVVFELDKMDYQYAFVSGPDTGYLWFLSRTPEVDDALMKRFIQQANELGFDTDALIFPAQSSSPPDAPDYQ